MFFNITYYHELFNNTYIKKKYLIKCKITNVSRTAVWKKRPMYNNSITTWLNENLPMLTARTKWRETVEIWKKYIFPISHRRWRATATIATRRRQIDRHRPRYRWSAVYAKEKYRLKVGNTCWSDEKRDLGKWARSGGLGSGRPPRKGKPNRPNSKE